MPRDFYKNKKIFGFSDLYHQRDFWSVTDSWVQTVFPLCLKQSLLARWSNHRFFFYSIFWWLNITKQLQFYFSAATELICCNKNEWMNSPLHMCSLSFIFPQNFSISQIPSLITNPSLIYWTHQYIPIKTNKTHGKTRIKQYESFCLWKGEAVLFPSPQLHQKICYHGNMDDKKN